MKKEFLIVNIDDQEACLEYDIETWTLSLFKGSSTPEFRISMDDVKDIYISSRYTETHYKEKNKLARTIIGGALLGPTGAIIGAVSGEGDKEIVDAKYSCIHIETSEREYVLICKEHGILNSSNSFVQGFKYQIKYKYNKSFRKEKQFQKKFAIFVLALLIITIIIVLVKKI